MNISLFGRGFGRASWDVPVFGLSGRRRPQLGQQNPCCTQPDGSKVCFDRESCLPMWVDTSTAQYPPCVNGKPAECAGGGAAPPPAAPSPQPQPAPAPPPTAPQAPVPPPPTMPSPTPGGQAPIPVTGGVPLPAPTPLPTQLILPSGPIGLPGQGFPSAVIQSGTFQENGGRSTAPMAPRQVPMRRTKPAVPYEVERVISGWGEASKRVARQMAERYGKPDESCSGHLAWYGKGAWHLTIVQKEEVPHHFPMVHSDVLTQAILYPVDPEMYDELARFNGSVIVERTWGMLGAMCGDEAMNFLIVNLAHDIARNAISWTDARDKMAELAKDWIAGGTPDYATGLRFSVPQDYHGNTDQASF